MTVLNREHERFYAPILGGSASSAHLVQPDNRGTAPALLCALRRLIERGHMVAWRSSRRITMSATIPY